MAYGLVRARRWAYSGALITLVLIAVFAAVQITTSRTLRGKSMPNDLRLYVAVFTLLALLLLRIPRIWNQLGLGGPDGGPGSWQTPTGLSAFAVGLVVATTPVWAVSNHIIGGVNTVNVLHSQLTLGGAALMAGGIGLLAWDLWQSRRRAVAARGAQRPALSSAK